MKSLLILPHIKIESANAISGLTYGFPSVTHFLGYVHALSRELAIHLPKVKLKLGGCGIVCHQHQVHAYEKGGGGEQIFSLTKNPLTKDGATPSFNEEGKMHLEVSLIIECHFTIMDIDPDSNDIEEDGKKFEKLVHELAIQKRLAGGVITSLSRPQFYPIDHEGFPDLARRILREMLPGFVLLDRSDKFQSYLSKNPQLNSLEALLDFYTLKSKAIPLTDSEAENQKVEWKHVPKSLGGWLVPIQVGYKAISPLYEPGKVTSVRNPNVPFRFVEPIYGLGEWKGPHLIDKLEKMIWRYQYESDHYVCSSLVKNEIQE